VPGVGTLPARGQPGRPIAVGVGDGEGSAVVGLELVEQRVAVVEEVGREAAGLPPRPLAIAAVAFSRKAEDCGGLIERTAVAALQHGEREEAPPPVGQRMGPT
jgi:hypothetical protein